MLIQIATPPVWIILATLYCIVLQAVAQSIYTMSMFDLRSNAGKHGQLAGDAIRRRQWRSSTACTRSYSVSSWFNDDVGYAAAAAAACCGCAEIKIAGVVSERARSKCCMWNRCVLSGDWPPSRVQYTSAMLLRWMQVKSKTAAGDLADGFSGCNSVAWRCLKGMWLMGWDVVLGQVDHHLCVDSTAPLIVFPPTCLSQLQYGIAGLVPTHLNFHRGYSTISAPLV